MIGLGSDENYLARTSTENKSQIHVFGNFERHQKTALEGGGLFPPTPTKFHLADWQTKQDKLFISNDIFISAKYSNYTFFQQLHET